MLYIIVENDQFIKIEHIFIHFLKNGKSTTFLKVLPTKIKHTTKRTAQQVIARNTFA